MKIARALVVGGTVVAVLAAGAVLAAAVSPALHTLTVKLPDGGTAEIQYAGDVPPKVSFKDDPEPIKFLSSNPFQSDPAFTELQKMSAAMDRQMNELLVRAPTPGDMLQTGGLDVNPADVAPGTAYTSFSAQSDGGVFCSRSVEVSRAPGDKAPKVVTHTSGNCKAVGAPAASEQSPHDAHAATGPQQKL